MNYIEVYERNDGTIAAYVDDCDKKWAFEYDDAMQAVEDVKLILSGEGNPTTEWDTNMEDIESCYEFDKKNSQLMMEMKRGGVPSYDHRSLGIAGKKFLHYMPERLNDEMEADLVNELAYYHIKNGRTYIQPIVIWFADDADFDTAYEVVPKPYLSDISWAHRHRTRVIIADEEAFANALTEAQEAIDSERRA